MIAEMRADNCVDEMTTILRALADAYPQQVLVVLRTQISPRLITQRIRYGKFHETG